MTASPLSGYPPELYSRGISTVISPYRQGPHDPLAGHKTTCYLPRLMALRAAQSHACTEAIWFTHNNLLAEGSISNVILVNEGELLTPPVDTPVLPGLARALVLSLARDSGINVNEQALTINDLLSADEVLLTNSIMQVMPVVKIERHDVGGGQVGAMGRKLLEAYREVVTRECGCD
jgi:branched-subunit amino acid aminotransferase/4-amino-4-deoxychorismate lyase